MARDPGPFDRQEKETAGQSGAARRVHTGGGAYVEGSLTVQNGDFVGRDQVIHGDLVTGTQIVYQAPRPTIPLQRPPRAEHFTDRQDDLARLLAELQPGRAVALCGPGGIGKSALAAEAVWMLAPGEEPPARFPDGILFYSFFGKPDPAPALEHVALSLGQEPRPTPAAAALRALAGKNALLILDGTEEANDLGAVLEVRGGCGVLITSRSRRDAPAGWLDVAPLPAADAVILLQAWGGEYAAESEAAAQICEWVGHLPLAVRLAGRYLAQTGEDAAGYLEWLRETPLDALDQGPGRQESVRLLLDRSLAQVSQAAVQVLAVAGLLALASFDRAPVAAALDVPPNQLRRPLDELVRYGLLRREEERYAVSHGLVHTYARACCAPGEGAAGRLAACYEALVREWVEQGVDGYRRLDGERAHVMHLLGVCAEGGLWAEVRSLVWAIEDYLDLGGHSAERVQALEMGVQAARELGQRHDEGVFLSNLGNAHKNLGHVGQAIAHQQQAVDIARQIGDRRSEGLALGSLGNAYADLGQMAQAIESYRQALAIAHEIRDRHSEGALLGSLGSASYRLGEMAAAIDYFQQALAIARESRDRRGEGSRLGNLGSVYVALEQAEQAIVHYQQALDIARQIGDRRNEGTWLGNLGIAYGDLGQVERAIEYHRQALAIARQIGNRRSEGSDLGNLGNAYRTLGQVEEAIRYYEQCLVIHREIGDRHGEGADLGNLGLAYESLEQAEQAIVYYQQSLDIARQIGDRQGEAFRSWNLGSLLVESDPARAVALMSICVAYEREIGHPGAEEDAQEVARIAAQIQESG